jgi:hypothetical protein
VSSCYMRLGIGRTCDILAAITEPSAVAPAVSDPQRLPLSDRPGVTALGSVVCYSILSPMAAVIAAMMASVTRRL